MNYGVWEWRPLRPRRAVAAYGPTRAKRWCAEHRRMMWHDRASGRCCWCNQLADLAVDDPSPVVMTPRDQLAIAARQEWSCVVCRRPLEDRDLSNPRDDISRRCACSVTAWVRGEWAVHAGCNPKLLRRKNRAAALEAALATAEPKPERARRRFGSARYASAPPGEYYLAPCPAHGGVDTVHRVRGWLAGCMDCAKLDDARGRGAVVTLRPVDHLALLARHGYACALCRRRFRLTGERPEPLAVSWDRIVPGGPYSLENVQPVHWRCNELKGDRIDAEHLARMRWLADRVGVRRTRARVGAGALLAFAE